MNVTTFSELIKTAKKSNFQLKPINLILLGDSSLQLLSQAIIGQGNKHSLKIIIKEYYYNSIEFNIHSLPNNNSSSNSDLICLVENSFSLWLKFSELSNEEKSVFADNFSKNFTKQINILESKGYSNILVANFAELDDGLWGSYANKTVYSFLYQLRNINWKLIEYASKNNLLKILDISNISNQIKVENLYDFRLFETASMIFSIDSLSYISAKIIDIIRAQIGHVIKCIILDLDNTLWNGVISEDGINEIGLGEYNNGKSFVAIQHWFKSLKNRGIILTVCSKNDIHMAELPFIKHPNSILKLEDFTVFIANWNSKVDNINEIQRKLNIGFDSMVFIDDNPFERDLVKKFIPKIIVPSIPENPEDRLPFLMSLNLFETISYTSDDIERVNYYKSELQRNNFEFKFTDTRNYLKSLEIKAKIENLNEFNLPRFSQLSIRSNQFNLRTLRYQPSDLESIQKLSDRIIYCVSMKDKFGDYGIISGIVVVLDENKFTAFIESWFMSCRVLKRGLEQFLMNHLVTKLKQLGIAEIHGEIIKNEKNMLVYDFYKEFGYKKENHLWKLNLNHYKIQNTEIQYND